MARTPKNTLPVEEEDVSQAGVTKVNQAALAGLIAAGKQQEDKERESTGQQRSYVKIISDLNAKELNPEKPEFIKGAKYGSFVIANKKINLGTSPTITVTGTFKVYEETEAKSGDDKPKVLAYWMPEDAEQIPVDGIFDRPFISKQDGKMHVLRPVHWVTVRFDKFPEINDAVITFRSTGNSIYTKLIKLIKNSGVEIAPELSLRLKVQKIENKKWGKTYLYPDFEIVGRNFEVKNGKVVPVEDGMDAQVITDVLTQYAELATEYSQANMVARKKDISALIGAPKSAEALPPARSRVGKAPALKDEDEDVVSGDDGEESTTF